MIDGAGLAKEFWEVGRSESCPIYDMHGHMGEWSAIYFPRGDARAMIGTMDECGVRVLVFSHHTALMAPDIGNALSIEAVRSYPDRLRAYCVVNPNYPEQMEADLATFEEHADVYVGLKFLPDYHGIALTDSRYQPAWEFASERGLMILAHTWGGSPYNDGRMLAEVAARYPRARFLMAHCNFPEWETAVNIVQDLPNVYLDMTSIAVAHDFSLMAGGSLMQTSRGAPQVNGLIEYFVEEVGSDRIVFGSDLAWYSQLYQVGAVLFAYISDEARHDILHRNAEKLLGILA